MDSIAGEGYPRLLRLCEIAMYTSGSGTTYTAGGVTVTEAIGNTPKVGLMISSYVITSGWPDKRTWAKILTATTGGSSVITVDAWSNGTPTNGQIFTVDGYVMDLPYCNELVEAPTADILEHLLWRQDKGSKSETEFRGWKYEWTLNYSVLISPDVLISMRPALSMGVRDQLVLIPHNDQPGFNYCVHYVGTTPFSKFGITKGYKGVSFVFRADENLASWPLLAGYGCAFATNYGTCL